MGRDYDPVAGQWYENLEEEEVFQVVTVNEDKEIIQVLYLDGETEELDMDAWAEMDLEMTSEPEGWSGSAAEKDEDEDDWEEDEEDDEDDDWDDDDDDEDDDDLDDDDDRSEY